MPRKNRLTPTKAGNKVLGINRKFQFSAKQKEIITNALNGARIVLINGPAGTSKTYLAVYTALKLLLSNKIEDILYVRTAVESGVSIGALP